jgi:hypothetical protein
VVSIGCIDLCKREPVLESKYLDFGSARRVARDAGTDVRYFVGWLPPRENSLLYKPLHSLIVLRRISEARSRFLDSSFCNLHIEVYE